MKHIRLRFQTTMCASVLLLLLLACDRVAAQSGTKLEFEAASVKPAASQGPGRMMIGTRGGPGTPDPGRILYTNQSLSDLMTDAYDIKRSQLAGEPKWIDTERFDITAKVPLGTTKAQAKLMLQNLLADRFKLSVHRETKEMPIYALVTGKNGPRLKESTAAELEEAPPQTRPGGFPALRDAPPPPTPPPPPIRGGDRLTMASDGCPETPAAARSHRTRMMMFMNGDACVVDTGETMPGLADWLSSLFDRPVVDMTGLKGKYDFRLRFDPSSLTSGRGGMMPMMPGPPPGPMAAGGGPAAGGGAGQQSQEAAPDIFTAVQERLGLKLESRRAPADLLVIDHLDRRPTEN